MNPESIPSPTGTELEVCNDIARRQAHGVKKYGKTVAENPLTPEQWLQHFYEEVLDGAVYAKRLMPILAKKLARLAELESYAAHLTVDSLQSLNEKLKSLEFVRSEIAGLVKLVIPESHHEAAGAESVSWQLEQIRSALYAGKYPDLEKLRGFYAEIVKTVGHDCVLKELAARDALIEEMRLGLKRANGYAHYVAIRDMFPTEVGRQKAEACAKDIDALIARTPSDAKAELDNLREHIALLTKSSQIAADAYAAELNRLRAENASWPGLYKSVEKERDGLRAQLASMEKEMGDVMKERDLAESFADRLTSLILGEPIDWPFHDAKWEEALQEADSAMKQAQERNEIFRTLGLPEGDFGALEKYAQERMIAEARVKELEAERENWRLSSVCREKDARINVLTEAIDGFLTAVLKREPMLEAAFNMCNEEILHHFVERRDRALIYAHQRIVALLSAKAGGLPPSSLLSQAVFHVSALRRIEAMDTSQLASPDQCAAVAYVMDHLRSTDTQPVWHGKLVRVGTFEQGGEMITGFICETSCHYLRNMPTIPFGEKIEVSAANFDLVTHLSRQHAFSLRTFGPGRRTAGNLAHIRKELLEIEAKPDDLKEWIDVALLAFDGALRHGGTPETIASTLGEKLAENELRTWPDWRTIPDGEAITHVKVAGEGKETA